MTEHASEQHEESQAVEAEPVVGPAAPGPIALRMGPALAGAIGNRAMAQLARQMAVARQDHTVTPTAEPERVLVLGLYERPIAGGHLVPAQELLIREARQATGKRPIFMGGMEESFDKTWKPLAPSGLASGTLVQEAMEGSSYNIKAVYFNTAGVDLLAKFPPRVSAERMAQFPEGTFQTGAELRGVVANLAAGQHKVDVYVRHRGGLSIVRAGASTVEGAPLPAEWAKHLPPSFKTLPPDPGEGGGAPPSGKGPGPPAAAAEEEPPSTVRPGAKAPAPPVEAPPAAKLGPKPPVRAPGTPVKPVDPAVRNIAQNANVKLASEIDLMVVGTVLKGALAVAQFIGTILMLNDFMNMAENAMAKRGFILTAEREQAGEIRDRAIAFQRDYDKFSDNVHFMGFPLFIAPADPPSLKPVLGGLSDLGAEIGEKRRELGKQSARVKGALKEVTAKRKAAEAIITDPKASAAIAMATFGTAELAKIFAAYVDLDGLEGALMSADSALDLTLDRLDDDFEFVLLWFEYLEDIAVAGGVLPPRGTLTVTLPEPKAPEPDLDTPLPGP